LIKVDEVDEVYKVDEVDIHPPGNEAILLFPSG